MSASGITDDRNGFSFGGGVGGLGVIVPSQFNSQGGLKTNQSTDLLKRYGGGIGADDSLTGAAATA